MGSRHRYKNVVEGMRVISRPCLASTWGTHVVANARYRRHRCLKAKLLSRSITITVNVAVNP